MDESANKMIENLHTNTGKSLDEWIEIVRETGITKHSGIIEYLKTAHDFTHGFANLVAHKSKGSDAGSTENPDDLVMLQYMGKETLKPIYDQLVAAIEQLGDDIEFAPKKAYVSVRRKKQFAIIQPSTKTRVDLGLQLKEQETNDTLLKAGSWNTMVSHRVKLTDAHQIDQEVKDCLKEAYENAG
ncbi:MAG: DUF5655 domain-containing protein [Cyclobacteriaceae bacterium]